MTAQAVAAAAAGIPVAPAALRLYLRHTHQPAAGRPDPTFIPRPQTDGRWVTEHGTCYVAETEQTVWAECCRAFAREVAAADPTGGVGLTARSFSAYAAEAVGDPLPGRALFSVTATVGRLADLTSPLASAALARIGLGPTELLGDDHAPCQALSQAGEKFGWDAVRAPSAALRGGVCIALFHTGIPPAARWTLERANARPSVAVAVLTRYRGAERPAWLP